MASRDTYSGELQIIPATTGMASNGGGGLSSVLGGSLGGLLGGTTGNDPMFSIYTESWTAPWFADEVLKDPNLTHRVFRSRWLGDEKGWRKPGLVVTALRSLFGQYEAQIDAPTGQMMLDYLSNHIKVQHERTDVISMIVMEESDQDLIRDFLKFGHQRITDHIREIYRNRAQGSIANILGELQHVTLSDYRASLLQELAEQEKIRMMATANDQFAAQSLGLYVSALPVWPKTGIVIGASLLISILLYLAGLVALQEWPWPAKRAHPGLVPSRPVLE
jgi:hypothetical protein